jgi:hypothetical protein
VYRPGEISNKPDGKKILVIMDCLEKFSLAYQRKALQSYESTEPEQSGFKLCCTDIIPIMPF